MENFDDYFKQPTQEETDKAWLRQMCYDGQMDDEEIDEFVEAVYQWKERCVKQSVINTDIVFKQPNPQIKTLYPDPPSVACASGAVDTGGCVWACPGCGQDTRETRWICCCSQECLKNWLASREASAAARD